MRSSAGTSLSLHLPRAWLAAVPRTLPRKHTRQLKPCMPNIKLRSSPNATKEPPSPCIPVKGSSIRPVVQAQNLDSLFLSCPTANPAANTLVPPSKLIRVRIPLMLIAPLLPYWSRSCGPLGRQGSLLRVTLPHALPPTVSIPCCSQRDPSKPQVRSGPLGPKLHRSFRVKAEASRAVDRSILAIKPTRFWKKLKRPYNG